MNSSSINEVLSHVQDAARRCVSDYDMVCLQLSLGEVTRSIHHYRCKAAAPDHEKELHDQHAESVLQHAVDVLEKI